MNVPAQVAGRHVDVSPSIVVVMVRLLDRARPESASVLAHGLEITHGALSMKLTRFVEGAGAALMTKSADARFGLTRAGVFQANRYVNAVHAELERIATDLGSHQFRPSIHARSGA